MNRQLPERPNLEQLKTQAKELLRAQRPLNPQFKLADAQHQLATEYGFASWPRLKEHVEALGASLEERIDRFIEASTSNNLTHARALLSLSPDLPERSPHAAATYGMPDVLRSMLTKDPGVTTARRGRNGWTPLMACVFSFWVKDEARKEGVLECARQLLDAGADPNETYTDGTWGALPTLWGATGVVNSPEMTELLLSRGANPDDNESYYHAAEHRDRAVLELLHRYGGKISNTNALKRKLDYDDLDGVRWFLEHGADPNEYSPNALHHAVLRGRAPEFLELLVEHGVKIDALTPSGKTAYSLAYRLGNQAQVECLANLGADTTLTPSDKLAAACTSGNEAEARRLLEEMPEAMQDLVREDPAILFHQAAAGNVEGVRCFIAAGFPVDTIGESGGTPLQMASFTGQPEVVQALLEAGANIHFNQDLYKSPPLGWAHHAWHSGDGSRKEQLQECMRLLRQAGAPLVGTMADEEDEGLRAALGLPERNDKGGS